ncbi:MAG: hypothetical protein EOP48_08630 [Sphingobacteriales bacterium]|nr:MAG: hypothetical protein EOP48_08630 [Sphingobacteriales bacterium]
MNQNSKQLARNRMYDQLTANGCILQDMKSFNLTAGAGVAIREYQTDAGPAKTFIDRAASSKSRTILSKINKKTLNEILFPLCTHDEQKQIVQEVESRLSVCDKIDETITDSLKQAEASRKIILKKAFEGDLII